MEALLSQFFFLAKEACHDKTFDPQRIEELMKLFEQEAYNSWAAMEADAIAEVKETDISMREAEEHLNSLMAAAIEDFESFNIEMNQKSDAEMNKLVSSSEAAKKAGDSLGNAMNIGANKYMNAALLSAMKSAFKTSKVHPS